MKFEFIYPLFFLILEYRSKAEVNEISGSVDINEDLDYFSRCYDEIGCIETDSRWYDKKLRPVNLKPADRHIIKTDFLLIKPSVTEYEDDLFYNTLMAKSHSINTSGFNKSSDLMILIHDFTGNGYTGWVKHLAHEVFLNSLDYNVMSVDWQRGAEPPYDQAIANARVVALEIVHLLKELKEKMAYSLDGVHIVGHGVGAHIAGYVGAFYNCIRKITALDPSGPRFEGMPDIVKLNPSNAKYVEVIHTDAYHDRSQGTREVLGHSDFFINNADHQPGCPLNNSFRNVFDVQRNSLAGGEIAPGCSHKRSFKYFIESLSTKKCTFMGIRCTSYEDFVNGRCVSCAGRDEDCKTFGTISYRNAVQKTIFYLHAADKDPFCMFQYQISVKVKNADTDYFGYFDFILVDTAGNAVDASPTYNNAFRNISSNSNNTFVYYAQPPRLLTLKEAKIRWNEKKKFYCIVYCKQFIDVERIDFKPIDLGDALYRKSSLCPANGETRIENGAYRMFIICNKEDIPETTVSPEKINTVGSRSSSNSYEQETNAILLSTTSRDIPETASTTDGVITSNSELQEAKTEDLNSANTHIPQTNTGGQDIPETTAILEGTSTAESRTLSNSEAQTTSIVLVSTDGLEVSNTRTTVEKSIPTESRTPSNPETQEANTLEDLNSASTHIPQTNTGGQDIPETTAKLEGTSTAESRTLSNSEAQTTSIVLVSTDGLEVSNTRTTVEKSIPTESRTPSNPETQETSQIVVSSTKLDTLVTKSTLGKTNSEVQKTKTVVVSTGRSRDGFSKTKTTASTKSGTTCIEDANATDADICNGTYEPLPTGDTSYANKKFVLFRSQRRNARKHPTKSRLKKAQVRHIY